VVFADLQPLRLVAAGGGLPKRLGRPRHLGSGLRAPDVCHRGEAQVAER
jgi:hypothetical protein